ncbi:unnamed protein product, partial [Prunus brigantina]
WSWRLELQSLYARDYWRLISAAFWTARTWRRSLQPGLFEMVLESGRNCWSLGVLLPEN